MEGSGCVYFVNVLVYFFTASEKSERYNVYRMYHMSLKVLAKYNEQFLVKVIQKILVSHGREKSKLRSEVYHTSFQGSRGTGR